MAVRKQAPAPAPTSEIPAELYRGLQTAAAWAPTKTGPSSREMYLWSKSVRAAGYTVRALLDAALSDPGYLTWLRHQERRSRLLVEDVERFSPRGGTARGARA